MVKSRVPMPQAPQTAQVQTETVTIEKLVYGGHGLARLASGQVVFVPGLMAGETAEITVNLSAKPPLIAQEVTLTTPHPQRIVPPCSVFATCGGCQWQFMPTAFQEEAKTAIVAESFSRIGKIQNPPVQPVIGANRPWQFRNKVTWVVTGPSEARRLGYVKEGSRHGVPFETCHIIPGLWNDLARALEAHILPKVPHLTQVAVRGANPSPTEGDGFSELSHWVVELRVLEESGEAICQGLSAILEAFPQIQAVRQTLDHGKSYCIYGEDGLVQGISGKKLKYGGDGFFQTNVAVTELLIQWLNTQLQTMELPSEGSFMDLYAGVGLFSVTLGHRFSKGYALESGGSACRSLRGNLKKAGLQDVIQVIEGTAEKALMAMDEEVHVAIVDPPRAGCEANVLSWLSTHVGHTLFYVSCNPTTLARDVSRLLSHGNWRLETIQPFDMFPQTSHVEAVAVLTRQHPF